MTVKVNLGCGRDIKPKTEGWVNVDLVPGEGVDLVVNLMERWPFTNECVDVLFSSHMVEHIPQFAKGDRGDGFVHFIREAWRVLKPGGVLHLKYPAYTLPPRVYFQNPTHYRIIPPEAYRGFLLGMKHVTCIGSWAPEVEFKKMVVSYRRALITRTIWLPWVGSITAWHWMKYVGGWLPIGRKVEMEVKLWK